MNQNDLYDQFDIILNKYGAQAVSAIQQRITDAGKVKSGALRDSIEFQVDGQVLNILALDYFDFLEYGTRKGIVPTDLLSETEPIFTEMSIEMAQASAGFAAQVVRDALLQSISGLSNIKLETQ